MAMILGLRIAVYTAPDLERGKLFYSQVLGTAPYFDEPFYVGYNVGGFELGLVPDGPRGAGGTSAYWGVADIEAGVAWVTQCGGNLDGGIQDVGGGHPGGQVRRPVRQPVRADPEPALRPGQGPVSRHRGRA
jgi:predicted enzyme related to lactoylglutathione lyase